MYPRLALAMVISGALLTAVGNAAEPAPPAIIRSAGPVEVNGIAAKVNGRVVTKNQVSFLLAPVYARLMTQFPRRGPQFDAKFKEAKTGIIQELIDRQLILDEFKQLNQTIKPSFVDDEVKRQLQEHYNGDEVKFREELKRNRLTMEGFREMTKDKLVVQAMRQQQFSDAPPPLPNEIQNEYNEVKRNFRDMSKDVLTFQKIFIPASDPQNPQSTPDMQLTLAEGIAKQLSEGKDFTELAKAQSKDAYAETGGLQENVPRSDLAPEFSSIVVDSPIGKVVGPLLDRQGFTLVKPIKIDFGPVPPLSGKMRDMIEEAVRQKKTSVQYKRWIESKRKRAMIDARD
jgi:peptidyl-prolyl cis-trans isomerase SurA